jgi:hypothetical protein
MTDELQPDPNAPDPNAPPADDQDEAVELASLAVDDGKGGKMVPLSALIGSKKTQRELQKRVKELEPIAARVTKLDGQLTNVQPIINALMSSPKLRSEAMRIASGTRPTADTTEQPDDADLTAFAEDSGFYLADGMTPDSARAGRVLARLDARNRKQTGEQIAPLAGITLNQKASANLSEAMKMEDADGTPMATRESILEVAKQLPAQLLADPAVVDLVLNSAIGLDRRKNRTPKPVDEPLFLERQGGGRPREATLSAGDREFLKRSGVTEKEYRASTAKLEAGVASRRGIELGKD